MPFMSAARQRSVRLLRRSAVAAALVFALALVLTLFPSGPSARAVAEPSVGSVSTFWAENWSTGTYSQIQATAKFVGSHVVVYVADGALYTDSAAASLGNSFDSTVYPTLTSAYGSEPDPGIDGDSHVVILVYDFHDYLPGSVDGSFYPPDIDPPAGDPNNKAHSNRREMFYLNDRALSLEPGSAVAVAAHEFAHLIIHYQNVMLDTFSHGSAQAQWLEEGLAMYAEHLCGYDDRADSMLGAFTHSSDTDLTFWGGGDRASYGASYSFVRYLAGREGPAFINALVQQHLDGVAGINAVFQGLGIFDDFDSVFDDWILAGFLDTRSPRVWPYVFDDIDVAMGITGLTGASPVRGTEDVKNYGAVYLNFPASDTSTVFQAVIDGDDGAPLQAALVSWDSEGAFYPNIKRLVLDNAATGDTVSGPAGYDRHTLVIWSRGAVGQDVSFGFKYSGASDPPGGIQFLDKAGSDPYYDNVAHLLARGVVSGYEIPSGSGLWFFKGSNNVTRAQFAKMIMLAVGLHTTAIDNPDHPTFTDVPLSPTGYPYDFVEEAAALKIVAGFGDGTFRPGANITRGQLAAMIVRGAQAAGRPLPLYSGNARVFADVPVSHSPDSLYMNVMAAYSAGILNGTWVNGILCFNPSSPATRDHVAKMTDNLMGRMEAYVSPGL